MSADEPPRGGLFLDLDGTLADSLHVMRAVYAAFLRRFDRPADDREFEALNGPPLPEVVRRLQQAHDLPGSLGDLIADYQSVVDSAYADVSPTSGAGEMLAAAAASGWVVGIVTSNAGRRTWLWLDRTGLAPLVDFVIAGEDVRRGKPHPEPYLLALSHSGCRAEQAIAVEDSPQGVAAALAAGLTAYAFQPASRPALSWPEGARPLARLQELIPFLVKPAAR